MSWRANTVDKITWEGEHPHASMWFGGLVGRAGRLSSASNGRAAPL